jgi:hypothetical protein
MYTQHVPVVRSSGTRSSRSTAVSLATHRAAFIHSAEFVLVSPCLDVMWSRCLLVDVDVWVLRRKAGTR